MFLTPAILSSVLMATGADAPKSQLIVAPCDVGQHWQFEKPSCDFQLTNTGDTPIRVSNIRGALAWDKGGEDTVVPPHGSVYARATVDLRDAVGQIKRTIRFETSEPGILSERGTSVYAFVLSALDQASPVIEFGPVKGDGERSEVSVKLSSREVADFRIAKVLSKPDFLDVRLGEDGRTVSAKLGKDAPWGLLHEKIRVQTNVPWQPEAWVTVEANVIGTIAPSGNPYSFGLIRTDKENRFLIRLTSDNNKDFKIGKVMMEGVKGDVSVVACVPKKIGCRDLQIDISNQQVLGRLQGEVKVELPELKRVLPIQIVGMLLSPDVKVVDLNEEAEKAGKAQSPVEAAPKESTLDLSQSLKQAVNKEALASPPGKGPLLRWSVENEKSVYGYVVYRADSDQGNAVRVSKDVIRVHDQDANGVDYQWRDTTAVAGKKYWYSIDMIKGGGERLPLVEKKEVVAK